MSIFGEKHIGRTVVVVVAAVIAISSAIVLAPAVADSAVEVQADSAKTASPNSSDADPYRSTEPVTASEYHPPILIVQPAPENKIPEKPAYAPSVLKALKYMKITADHLNMWADKHANSKLNGLSALPADQQRRVAAIACYIRRTNRRVSAENVWREACAMYFYGKQYGIAPELIAAVAKIESTYNLTSVSRHGACGPMQVMYRVHGRTLARHKIVSCRDDMFDPERGIHAGTYVLKGYINSCGSVYTGLMRYLGRHSKRYYMRVQNTVTGIRRTGEALHL